MKKTFSLLLVMLICVTAIITIVPSVKADATTDFEQKNVLQIWAESSSSYISGKWYSTSFDGTNIQDSGCGIVSLVSAVYNLGGTIDKSSLGDVINEVYYWAYYTDRWSGSSGTYESMFPASDDQYGSKYHFSISEGQGKNLSNLVNHIKAGAGTAVVHVYNHYMVIVDYKNESGVEYLRVFDPAPGKVSSSRNWSINRRSITTAAGDWIKVSNLQYDGGGAIAGDSWENVEISNYWLVYPESTDLTDLTVDCTGFTPNENEFIPYGNGYPVWGTVNSNYPLSKVVAKLDGNEYGKWEAANSTTYSFAVNPTEINKNLKFAELSVGQHTITLIATDIYGRTKTFLERKFDVGLYSGNSEIENSNVFLKQETSTTCTLSAATMMVRRTAIIKGLDNWESITESSMRKVAWKEGSGLYFNFIYTHNGVAINVTTKQNFSGDYATKKAALIELLKNYPQGIEIYNTSQPHAVLLTKYDASTDTFYCADSSGYAAKGQIPLSQSSLKGSGQEGKINGITMYWYVSSPVFSTSCSHSYSTTYSNDANNHWKVCSKCGSTASVEPHAYTNACDTSCNTCGATRTVNHSYEKNLDESYHWKECTSCGSRTNSEAHDWIVTAFDEHHTLICGGCYTSIINNHVYSNDCDPTCDTCNYTRTITHIYSNSCDTSCNVCGAARSTSHEYDNVCDPSCNICGETRVTKHKYSNPCDTSCDSCGATRSVPGHVFDHNCDTSCNNCGYSRPTDHTYENNCDASCNVCGAMRTVSHTYTSRYLSNATSHWRTCTSCGYNGYIEDHIPGSPATETSPQRCIVCEFVIQEALGHTHQLGTDYEKDSQQHWYQCTDKSCGAKVDIEDHLFDSGVVKKEPTTTEKGEMIFTCEKCGAEKHEDVAVLPEDFETSKDPEASEPPEDSVKPIDKTNSWGPIIAIAVIGAVVVGGAIVTAVVVTVVVVKKKSVKVKENSNKDEKGNSENANNDI